MDSIVVVMLLMMMMMMIKVGMEVLLYWYYNCDDVYDVVVDVLVHHGPQ